MSGKSFKSGKSLKVSGKGSSGNLQKLEGNAVKPIEDKGRKKEEHPLIPMFENLYADLQRVGWHNDENTLKEILEDEFLDIFLRNEYIREKIAMKVKGIDTIENEVLRRFSRIYPQNSLKIETEYDPKERWETRKLSPIVYEIKLSHFKREKGDFKQEVLYDEIFYYKEEENEWRRFIPYEDSWESSKIFSFEVSKIFEKEGEKP